MIIKICQIFVVAIHLMDAASAENNCFLQKRTWSTENQLGIHFEVEWNQCIGIFLQNESAIGFTWYAQRARI